MPSGLSHPEELVFGANAKRDPGTGKIIETGIGSLSQLQQVQAALAAAAIARLITPAVEAAVPDVAG